MEVATKVRLGRLEGARTLVETWDARLLEVGASQLSITAAHALRAGAMTWEHHDPFDRLLVAQAVIENIALVTTDPAITAVPVPGTPDLVIATALREGRADVPGHA